jgi:hypothetical protein
MHGHSIDGWLSIVPSHSLVVLQQISAGFGFHPSPLDQVFSVGLGLEAVFTDRGFFFCFGNSEGIEGRIGIGRPRAFELG